MSAIYLYVLICGGTDCDYNRFPMKDLATCAKFAETFKPAFPPNTTENEGHFAVFCAGEHQSKYEGTWFNRPTSKATP